MASKTKGKRRRTSRDDPATQYALDVVSGRIVAGPHVRDECARHLRDLEHGGVRGLRWDLAAANRAISFFADVLTVEIETEDEYGEAISEAVPFILDPSQAFIVGSLFGWKNKHGLRRFRRAYVEEAKGNGKSPLAAGIGHYMLVADGKLRAEIYSAATDMDQAMILFRDASEMRNRSPDLAAVLLPSGINPVWQLTYTKTSSFFRPISSEKKGKSGIRPHCGLIDEIHEHPDGSVIEMLRAGTKGNRQALIFEITNSGFDRTSKCWEEHEYSVKVSSGEVENDAWFSYVCALDEGDEPFEDESCWVKANPLLGVTIRPEYIREQVEEAKGMPGKESIVRRLNFCQWTDAEVGWIKQALWHSAESATLTPSDFVGRELFGGLDLSYSEDLSACAWAYHDGPVLCVMVDYWKPKDGIHDAVRSDRVPYAAWASSGFIILTPGPVIRTEFIAHRIGAVAKASVIKGVAYDRYRYRELADDLDDEGVSVPMFDHPQGFRRKGAVGKGEPDLWMPRSIELLENRIKAGTLRVVINPVLAWNVGSAVVREDPVGNQVLDKKKSKARIDGAVALAMAVGLADARDAGPQDSVYEGRGLLEV